MIALLTGEVAVRRADHVVVLCGDVGYRASISAHTLAHVPAVGERVALHTHLIAREDALVLYGFHSEQERELFLMLLSVQAVGPKVALAVLSGGAPRELLAALAAGDSGRFQAVPGIGKRTAERIIVELREKVDALAPFADPPPPGAPEDEAPARTPIVARRADGGQRRQQALMLAREGLIELGYSPTEAQELLLDSEGETAEEQIAEALRLARADR